MVSPFEMGSASKDYDAKPQRETQVFIRARVRVACLGLGLGGQYETTTQLTLQATIKWRYLLGLCAGRVSVRLRVRAMVRVRVRLRAMVRVRVGTPPLIPTLTIIVSITLIWPSISS